MSLETRVRDAIIRIATEFNTVKTSIGDLTSLSTTDKSSIVNAINELDSAIASFSAINDSGTGSTDIWSATKITSEIQALRTSLLGSAGSAYDTFQEIQAFIESNDSDIAGLLTAIGNRVRFDAPQTLTAPQRAQAQANMNVTDADAIGNTDRDFVADFESSLS